MSLLLSLNNDSIPSYPIISSFHLILQTGLTDQFLHSTRQEVTKLKINALIPSSFKILRIKILSFPLPIHSPSTNSQITSQILPKNITGSHQLSPSPITLPVSILIPTSTQTSSQKRSVHLLPPSAQSQTPSQNVTKPLPFPFPFSISISITGN